jgi:hypothetical protein
MNTDNFYYHKESLDNGYLDNEFLNKYKKS